MKRMLSATLVLAAMLALGPMHWARAEYPEKPIRIVLPYPPGGGGDVVIRTLQPAVEKRLGQSIIVDYRPGAAGNIGMMEVVKAAPDGYTLVLAPTNNFVINQFLFKGMNFDPLSDLAPVTMLVENPYLVTVNASVPAQAFSEFASYARANPGKLNFGSPGNATVPHLSGLMISDYLGARMVHVPYRGSQPGLQALITNDVQMFVASYGIIVPYLTSGKARALVVSGNERLKALPGVPTAAEAGVPAGILFSNWWGIAAPRIAAPAVLSRLAQDFRAAAEDAEIRKKFLEQGAIAINNTPAAFANQMRIEANAWKGIIEKTGAKLDN